jgi:mono/diheme cytochrome c family protein
MFRSKLVVAFAVATIVTVLGLVPRWAQAEGGKVERGKYLVTIMLCGDCHTPGYLLGKPDMSRVLAGSEVGFEVPGMGVFHGRNLTPDNATGIGTWTEAQIVAAISTGITPDGRRLAPIMPSAPFSQLTASDAEAIAAYLKTLPPVSNKVPGPFAPTEKPTAFIMKVVPPMEAERH